MRKLLSFAICLAFSGFALTAHAEEVGTRNITPSQQVFETISIPEDGKGDLSVKLNVGGG